MKRNVYWVVENRFLAGEYPRNIDEKSSLDKIASLIRAGVSAFVDLTEEDEGLRPYSHLVGAFEGVSHQRFRPGRKSRPRFSMRLMIIFFTTGPSICTAGEESDAPARSSDAGWPDTASRVGRPSSDSGSSGRHARNRAIGIHRKRGSRFSTYWTGRNSGDRMGRANS